MTSAGRPYIEGEAEGPPDPLSTVAALEYTAHHLGQLGAELRALAGEEAPDPGRVAELGAALGSHAAALGQEVAEVVQRLEAQRQEDQRQRAALWEAIRDLQLLVEE